MSATNKNNNFALVTRPPGALQKTKPGARRIRSGMVADTLALVKKKPPIKPVVSIFVAGGIIDSHAELFEVGLRTFLSDQYDLRFVAADNAMEVLKLAEQQPFDLFIVLLAQVWQGLNKIQLDPPDGGTWGDRISFLTRLKKQFGKPIIAISTLGEVGFAERAQRAGADACLWFADFESLLATVRSCLKTQHDTIGKPVELVAQPHATRTPRIVVVHHDLVSLEIYEYLINKWFKNVSLLLLSNSHQALQELSQCDPDLLIIEDVMPGLQGEEIVRGLAARKVAYPIVVHSGREVAKQWVRECANFGLDVTYSARPTNDNIESYRKLLEVSLKIPRYTFEKPVETTPQRRNTHPYKIVVVDDENWLLEMVELAIGEKFKNVVLETFQNGDKAREELLRAEPDLLIAGLFNNNVPGEKPISGMNGFNLLRHLQQKKVEYPILVMSAMLEGNHNDSQLVQREWPDLKISLLKKPFTIEQFYTELDKHLGHSEPNNP